MPKRPASDLTYEVQGKFDPDAGRVMNYIVATCFSCKRKESIRWNHPNAPDPVARTFRNRGWLFDKHNLKGCICPKCQESKDMAVRPAKRCTAATPTERCIDNIVSLAAEAIALKPLTPEQRQRVRHALDQHFDDSKGVYLDGKSDKLLGEELGIPWRHVQDLREFAYGPLRGDPALDELETRVAELVATGKRLEEQHRKLTTELNDWKHTMAGVNVQLADLRKRFS